jgi:ribosomal protein S17
MDGMHRTNYVQRKSKSPLSVFEKNMILNIYKHVCDEHAELKVGDTVKLTAQIAGKASFLHNHNLKK